MLDCNRYTVEVWNGGLPSAYIRKGNSSELKLLSSNHLPLGIMRGDKFNDATSVHEVEPGDRLFLATDGVIEARNSAGEYFGSDRLEGIVSGTAPDELFDRVQDQVYGFVSDQSRDDDITMVEITVVPPEQLEAVAVFEPIEDVSGPRDWKFSYELGPHSLKDFNPLPLLQQVLMGAPYLRSKATSIYAVLAELYSNGLEHGVLGLDSVLKSSAEGFTQYYAARASALEQVSGFVRFDIEGDLSQDLVSLRIRVTDSGDGFDYVSFVSRAENAVNAGVGYHGRGIRLLWDLCESVKYIDPGNEVEVIMQWDHSDE